MALAYRFGPLAEGRRRRVMVGGLGVGSSAAAASFPVPAPAAAVGFTSQTFLDQFSSLSTIDLAAAHTGKNWYIDQAPNFKIGTADYTAASATWYSATGGVLTITDNVHSGGAENMPTVYTAPGSYTTQFPLIGGGNGGYVEGLMKFALPATDTFTPNFWLLDIEGAVAQMDGAGTFTFSEIDILEGNATQAIQTYHKWTAWNTSSFQSSSATLSGVNYTQFHKWGVRWQTRAQNGGTGTLQWFVDGIATGNSLTWVADSDLGANIEAAQFIPLFSAGASQPLLVDYIGVWQAPSAYSAYDTQFFARIADPGTTRKNLLAALIDGVVADGVWPLLDVLTLTAGNSSGNSIVNIRNSKYTAVLNGAPSFTIDRGFTGIDGSTATFIDTGFNPATAIAPRFTQNSGHIGAWCNTNVQAVAGGALMGLYNGSNNTSQIFPKFSDGKAYFRLNDTTGTAGIPNADATGHYVSNRSAAGAQQGYRNAVSQGVVADTSTAANSGNIYVLAQNTIGTGGAVGGGYQVCAYHIGASLTQAQITALYNRLRTYMTAVGVP